MESGFYCPDCLKQLAWLSTTNADKYYCDNCDKRFTSVTAYDENEVINEVRKKK